jgi:hypothetical protein
MFVLLRLHEVYEKIVPCFRIEHHHSVVVQKAVSCRVLGPIAFLPRRLRAFKSNRIGLDQAPNICEVFSLPYISEKALQDGRACWLADRRAPLRAWRHASNRHAT